MSRRATWLTLMLLLAAALSGCNLSQYAPAPVWTPVTEPTPTATPLSEGEGPTPITSLTPEGAIHRAVATGQTAAQQAVVCTGYAEGALNVRTCPGVGCWAFFPLYEGQVVTLDGQTAHTQDGATWVHLTHPVEGWVNAKYLCEVQP